MRPWGVVVGAIIALAVSSAHAQSALDKPSFTASPAELLAIAKATRQADRSLTFLRQETHLSLDDQGRATRRTRLVLAVWNQDLADAMEPLTFDWLPSYQDRPQVRVRVIAPGGTITENDPSLITEGPAVARAPDAPNARRELTVPLPRLQAGAVIEHELVKKDRVPLFAAGTVERTSLDTDVPVESVLHTVSAPVRLGVKVAVRGPSSTVPHRTVSGAREVWTLRRDKQEGLPAVEPSTPSDVIQRPYLAVATGASWNKVAREYRRLVERTLAEGPVTLPAELPRTPRIETVRAIVAWLHREIRYTGIGFADAPLVPRSPAETRKHGAGSCNDKAMLLVALLRRAGIRADLALLSTGPGTDIDPELPGMGLFDHAVVRAKIGGRDVWIDATEELFSVGTLPPPYQGRRALVIADTTRSLELTPRATSADNAIVEVRTFDLPQLGMPRVTVVSRESGAYGAATRAWFRDTRAEDVRMNLSAFIERKYGSETLERYATTSPTDLATPFEVTVVAARSKRAYMGQRGSVYLFPADVLSKLPESLAAIDGVNTSPRRHAFELLVPHTYEIENRIVIPPGYELPQPAPGRKRALGVMTLTERHRLEGRTLIVTFRLDTGKPRMSPAEVDAVRSALRELRNERRHIEFQHRAYALLDNGKPKEAIAEVERLIRMHPSEAVHHSRLAYVYLRAGAGAAARRAARKAVELEPGNAEAHAMLAWVLRRDTFGRDLGFDHDRAGALASYRRARTLDPSHVDAAAGLATLLSVSPDGEDFGEGADLAGAAAAWRTFPPQLRTDNTTLELARTLLWARRFAEAESIARHVSSIRDRDPLYVAAVALAWTPSAAINAANAFASGAERNQLLVDSAWFLVRLREYDRARELISQSGASVVGTFLEKFIGRVQRQPAMPRPSRDPVEAWYDAVYAAFVRSYETQAVWDEPGKSAVLGALRIDPTSPPEAGIGRTVFWDIVRSSPPPKVEGRPRGPWRVSGEVLGRRLTFYIAPDKGIAKVFAGRHHLTGFGRHALRLLAARDEGGARQSLDWARAEMDAAKASDGAGFTKHWRPGAPTDKVHLSVAAALVAMHEDGIPILTSCASTVPGSRARCDRMLAYTYASAERWDELDKHAVVALSRAPADERKHMSSMRARALAMLGKLDEAAKLFDQHLATEPDDMRTREWAANLAYERGAVDEAIRRHDEIARHAKATADAKNAAAWVRVGVARELQTALALAQEAVRADPRDTSSSNTLAVIHAELGDVAQARTEGIRSMEIGGRQAPEPQDWYLFGRMYEQIGLRDDAIAAYRKVQAREGRGPGPSSYVFARKRLAKLGVKLPSR